MEQEELQEEDPRKLDDILEVIMQLKNRSPGVDGIGTEMI